MLHSKHQKTTLVLCAFLILILLCVLCLVRAQTEKPMTENGSTAATTAGETVYYDRTDDQLEYGKLVAELNRQQFVTVLCQTEGQEPDFDPWNPVSVVEGPDHSYTLYFADEEAAERAIRELNQTAGVLYAEPDFEISG